MESVEVGSKWKHRNGIAYTVIAIANVGVLDPITSEKYPPTVVYQGTNGKVWARYLSDWGRSFTREVKDEVQSGSSQRD